MSSFCDYGHTIQFSKINCVVRKNGSVAAIREQKCDKYPMELRGAGEKKIFVFGTSNLRMKMRRQLSE